MPGYIQLIKVLKIFKMESMKQDYKKNQLKAYVLTYCANANFVISNDEVEFIKSKTCISNLNEVQCEIRKNNDYQNIQRIIKLAYTCSYNIEDKKILFKEINELVKIGKDYYQLKLNTLRGLKHILFDPN